MHFHVRRIVAVAAATLAVSSFVAAGCGGTNASPVADAGSADASADASTVGNAFGEPCLKSSDCAAGVCLASGRCSKSCSAASDCPPGPEWICGAGGACACTPSGAEVCDGRDNDCDTRVDNGATCGEAKLSCQNGACACVPGNVCGSDCFDLQTDPHHCGSCTTACGSVCIAGKCATVTQIAAGEHHACALFSDGGVRCWGNDAYGQLGDGASVVQSKPIAPLLTSKAARVGVRERHSCVVGQGTVTCWGEDAYGELCVAATDSCEMPPTTSCVFRPTAMPIPSGFEPIDVALGGQHVCVLGKDGTVACAGSGATDQLGDGSTSRRTLARVPGLTNVKAIGAGSLFTCALLGDGTVKCWGSNDAGECGDGTARGTRASPVTVTGLSGVVSLGVGITGACAVTVAGFVHCWGASGEGLLGQPTPQNDCNVLTPCSATPIAVPGVSAASQVVVGRAHACARVGTAGDVKCWGSDDHGQLGYTTTQTCLIAGTRRPCSTTATQVAGITGVIDLVAGSAFTCARLAGTDVRCWGQGDGGELGDGTGQSRPAPGAVAW